MKSSSIQAKRCAEEFAKVVGLEFIDRYVVNEHLHFNIKILILVTTSIHFFRCQLREFCGASTQHDIVKIMTSIVIKLKGKFDVDLILNLQTRLIAYQQIIYISACLSQRSQSYHAGWPGYPGTRNSGAMRLQVRRGSRT